MIREEKKTQRQREVKTIVRKNIHTKKPTSYAIDVSPSFDGIKTKNNDIKIVIKVKLFVFYT